MWGTLEKHLGFLNENVGLSFKKETWAFFVNQIKLNQFSIQTNRKYPSFSLEKDQMLR